jgi:hypothetical protein
MLLVMSNPYLRNDATLRMFLTQRGGPEFEQAKKAASQGVGADPGSNPGLARWFGVLRHLALPVDADAACTELTAFMDETEVRVVACLGAVTKYWEAAKAMADSLRAMKDSLGDLHNASASAAGALSETLGPLRNSAGSLAGRVKKAADVFSNAYDLSVFSPNEIQIFLMDGLVTEIHRVRSMKALLAVRDAAQKAYSAAWVAQDKLHFQQKQFRDKAREDKALALEPKIAEAVGLMKRMKERLDDVTKGVLGVEADRGARARVDRFVAMTGQFSALCIASGVRSQELWAGFLSAMDLDQAAMVADAQATLTNQVTMHTMDALGATAHLPLPAFVVAAGATSGGAKAEGFAGMAAAPSGGAAAGGSGEPAKAVDL